MVGQLKFCAGENRLTLWLLVPTPSVLAVVTYSRLRKISSSTSPFTSARAYVAAYPAAAILNPRQISYLLVTLRTTRIGHPRYPRSSRLYMDLHVGHQHLNAYTSISAHLFPRSVRWTFHCSDRSQLSSALQPTRLLRVSGEVNINCTISSFATGS
jgi:hypothetical protein